MAYDGGASLDAIEIEILADGTIKIDTDKISDSNHVSAENLVRFLTTGVGGESTTKRKRAGHTHSHHGHTHSHKH